jgi:MoaA/NifB/PqqE/SkfB family radical SAM enzyme
LIEKAMAGAAAYGLDAVHVTGGEPFVYPELAGVFSLARRFGVSLSFSTNGLLLEQNARLLDQNKDLIRMLNISVDADSAAPYEAMRGEGNFPVLLRNLKFCRERRIPFGFNACVHAANRQDPWALARFARRCGAQLLNVSTALPCQRSLKNSCVLDQAGRSELIRRTQGAIRASEADPWRLFSVPVYMAQTLQTSSGAVMCPNQSLRSVTIDVDGSFHFCCFLTFYDLEPEFLKKLRLISLKDASFDEGLRIFTQTLQAFVRSRIADRRQGAVPDDVDFNSCFYCYKKLGLPEYL